MSVRIEKKGDTIETRQEDVFVAPRARCSWASKCTERRKDSPVAAVTSACHLPTFTQKAHYSLFN